MALPLLATAGLKGLGSLASGLIGSNAKKKAEEAQRAALAKYVQDMQNNALSPEDYVADYEQLNAADLEFYDPQMEVAEQMGDTELANITLDPTFKQAQMDALAAMTRRGQEGLTIEEEVARNEIMNAAGAANQGAQGAVLQQAARQGRLGAGDTLAAQMAAAGSAYSGAAQEAQNLAAQRDRRAMEAVLQSGNMAGNIRGQDYSEAANVAQARDSINQFNTKYRADANTRNVGATNRAGEGRAGVLRNVTTGNLDLRNKQADQLVGGRGKAADYQNVISRTKYDAASGEADRSRTGADNTSKAISGGINTGIDILNKTNLFGDSEPTENKDLTKKVQSSTNPYGVRS